jgi:ATP-dependent helicase/nuclease subunit A
MSEARAPEKIDYTPAQREAVFSRDRAICVDAGAGSGKTRVLMDRVVNLLEEGVDLDHIVAITFMEKAAQEMKARLRRAFRERAQHGDRAGQSKWRELERRIDSARISTIHGFCSGFLRENALHIGVDPDFAMLAEEDTALLLKDAITGALHDLVEAEHPDALLLVREMSMAELQQAMRKLLGREGELQRIELDATYASADTILAAWEAALPRERNFHLTHLWSDPKLRPWLRAMQAAEGWCEDAEEKRECWRRINIDGLGVLLSRAPAAEVECALARMASADAKGAKNKLWQPLSDAAFEAFKKTQDKIRKWACKALEEVSRDPEAEREAAEHTAALWRVYQHVRDAYTAAKASANGLDFDDLIALTRHHLAHNEAVRLRMARGMQYLLVDEFQDTDGAQLDIARLLHDVPDGPALFIVGDAKQSIYRFRGAEVDVFNRQREASGKIIPLKDNFRSVPPVLHFVNEFFTRGGLLDLLGGYGALAPSRACEDCARIEFILPRADAAANADAYRGAEAERIAARIQQMCAGTQCVSVGRKEKRPAAYGDVAILLRATSSIHLYEEALRRAGIPYVVEGGKGFYERQEVLDVLNLLKTVLDPWDEEALFAFLRSPIAGLSDDDLVAAAPGGLARAFNRNTPPENLPQHDRWLRARTIIGDLRARTGEPLPQFIRAALDAAGYEALLLAQFLGVQKAGNVRKLVELADRFGRARVATLHAFAAYLDDVRSQAAREGDAVLQPEGMGAVHIMTVHKSKGLEFPIVFVADTAREPRGGGGDPVLFHRDIGLAAQTTGADGEKRPLAIREAIQCRNAMEETAEDARILYVAMTRAEDYLVISGGPTAGGGSWLAALDGVFDVLGKDDGAIITGAGWEAIMRRDVIAPAAEKGQQELPMYPAADTLLARIAPLHPLSSPHAIHSVSSVLDAMCGTIHGGGGRASAPVEATTRGTLVHALFERWDFRNDTQPDITALFAETPVPLTAQEALRAELETIAARFRDSEFARMLGADAGLVREASFYLRVGEGLVSGKIDALLSDGTIIDYKTGGKHESSGARYEKQLLLYAATVLNLRGITPPRGLLWYVDLGELVEVAITPAAIDATLAEAASAMAT